MTSRETPGRHPYDDLTTVDEMHADCQAVGRNLRLERVARAAARPAPSILFEDYPPELSKREIEIPAAAARLAAALNLQLDGD